MNRRLLAATMSLVAVIFPGPPAAAAGSPAETIVLRGAVPSEQRKQGEVRLLLRDGNPVVQTVLYSRLLRRVAGTIAEKEEVQWPDGAPGCEDSRRYVLALADLAGRIREEQRHGSGPEEGRRGMVIEFMLQDGLGKVKIAAVDVAETGSGLAPGKELLPAKLLDLTPGYVWRNMVLILSDSLGLPISEVEAILEETGG